MDRRLLTEKTIGAVVLLTAGYRLDGSVSMLATLAWVIIGLETVSLAWITRANAAVTEAVLATTALVIAFLELVAGWGEPFGSMQVFLLAAIISALLLLIGAARSLQQG